jgi:phage FluMu protein Com
MVPKWRLCRKTGNGRAAHQANFEASLAERKSATEAAAEAHCARCDIELVSAGDGCKCIRIRCPDCKEVREVTLAHLLVSVTGRCKPCEYVHMLSKGRASCRSVH